MGYWEKRIAESQKKLTDKNIADTEAQLAKYYRKTQKKLQIILKNI